MNDTVTVSRELLRQIVDALRQYKFTTPPAQRKMIEDTEGAIKMLEREILGPHVEDEE